MSLVIFIEIESYIALISIPRPVLRRDLSRESQSFGSGTQEPGTSATSTADPDLEAGVKLLEIVSLQTLSPKALADAQALCKQVERHKFID